MSDGCTDMHRLPIPRQLAPCGYLFDIHEVGVVHESQAQQEDKLCPPGIDLGLLAETRQLGRRFGHGGGLGYAQGPEHDGPPRYASFPRPRSTFSGVIGSALMRTPTAS